jgi:hypothetical protein
LSLVHQINIFVKSNHRSAQSSFHPSTFVFSFSGRSVSAPNASEHACGCCCVDIRKRKGSVRFMSLSLQKGVGQKVCPSGLLRSFLSHPLMSALSENSTTRERHPYAGISFIKFRQFQNIKCPSKSNKTPQMEVGKRICRRGLLIFGNRPSLVTSECSRDRQQYLSLISLPCFHGICEVRTQRGPLSKPTVLRSIKKRQHDKGS